MQKFLDALKNPVQTRPNFSAPSSHFAVVHQSFCSRTTADQLYYAWIAEKKLVEKSLTMKREWMDACMHVPGDY